MKSAIAFIAKLDADELRRRIAALDRERKAMLVLLRAAIRATEPTKSGKEAVNAS